MPSNRSERAFNIAFALSDKWMRRIEVFVLLSILCKEFFFERYVFALEPENLTDSIERWWEIGQGGYDYDRIE